MGSTFANKAAMDRLWMKPGPNPMPDRKRFGLNSPTQLLAKLEWEIEQLGLPLDEEAVASYRAFNCAVTAWSICDWVWNSASANLQQRFREVSPEPNGRNSEPLAAFLRKDSRELAICQQLANGSKHFVRRSNNDEKVSAYRSASVNLYVSDDGRTRAVPGHSTFILDGDDHYADLVLFSRARDYRLEFFERYEIGRGAAGDAETATSGP